MTMLDRMRRHKHWLKWTLALVVLAFILLYIPDFLRQNGTGAAQGDVVARIEGRPVTVGEFRRVYNSQLQAYRSAYGGRINESLIRQLGLDRQILQQLIDERAALAEADRLGISADDAEVRERILNLPSFQENGQFIGESRYRQLLSFQNPPITIPEFEESIRRSIVLDKLRAALTEWIGVAEVEVDQEYRRRNEQVKLQLVAIPAERFREGVTATDAELSAYFEAHQEEFRTGERRKIRFIALDVQSLREKVVVLPQDVERSYNSGIEQYSTPEQVRASHILLKTEGKDEDAVRAQAQKVLAEARAGADFAALATKYSEDEGSKATGGDLDYFSRGRMVPEFEAAAYALEPGTISDLVKTPFGFHIIKVTDKRPASLRPLAEVQQQIIEQIKWERAQAQLQDAAARLEPRITAPSDLDKVAKAEGLTVKESGFFVRDEPIAGLGPSPEASAEAFSLEPGKVSGAVRTAQGVAFLTVSAVEPPRIPALDEAKEQVREAVVRQKALDAARAKAAALVATLRSAKDFAAAAKAAGFEAHATELVARGSALPEVGVSTAVDAAAFALTPGAISDPVQAGSTIAIVQVLERKHVTPDEIAAGRASLRDEMLADRRGRFFSAHMTQAKQRMKITIDRATLQRLLA
jgi:peptidyl-prolyl cis-trans isomerase D